MRARLAVVLAVVLAACGGAGRAVPQSPAASSGPGDGNPSGELTVFAAASLTDAFEAIGRRFEQDNPEVDVLFNFASSSTLATQIAEGAPADVFASADEKQMRVVEKAGLLASEPIVFAGNTLQIAVEPGNPRGIEDLADLARPDITSVLAAEEVPAGRYAREALERQGVEVEPASLETDVRAVLSRVALGEADAGIVYASDVMTAGGDIDGVTIPPDRNVSASYPVALLTGASNAAAGRAFIDALLSDEGQRTLREDGFVAP